MKYALLTLAILATGCASNSDVAKIQGQIDELKPQITQIAKDSADAKEAALRAFTVSEKLTQAHQNLNSKLDKIFKTSQHK